MTRVEKYHRYREEIANMRIESFSSKKKISEKMRDIDSSSMDFDQLMGFHKMYSGDKKTKKKVRFYLNKFQIRYCLIAFICLAIILLGIIFLGIRLWG